MTAAFFAGSRAASGRRPRRHGVGGHVAHLATGELIYQQQHLAGGAAKMLDAGVLITGFGLAFGLMAAAARSLIVQRCAEPPARAVGPRPVAARQRRGPTRDRSDAKTPEWVTQCALFGARRA